MADRNVQHQFERPHPSQPTEDTKLLQVKILEMYRDNPNFLHISRELGYHVSYIRKQYQKALRAIIMPQVEDHRKLQIARMDKLHVEAMRVLTAFHPVIAQGQIMRDVVEDEFGNVIMEEDAEGSMKPQYARIKDTGPVLAAIDRILKIEERRAKLLGLDAPSKTALTDPSGEKEATAVQFYIPNNNRDADDNG